MEKLASDLFWDMRCGGRALRATGKGMQEGILTSDFLPILYRLLVNYVNLLEVSPISSNAKGLQTP